MREPRRRLAVQSLEISKQLLQRQTAPAETWQSVFDATVVVAVHAGAVRARDLDRCLSSVHRETAARVEIVVVMNGADHGLMAIAEKHGAVVAFCDAGKAKSRNVGAEIARSNWLLHLDADMSLSQSAIDRCLAASTDCDALVLPEIVDPSSRWRTARELANRWSDESVHSPRFVSRRAALSVGGFDEEVDPVDEGSLKERLIAAGFRIGHVSAEISTLDRRSALEQWRGKYLRGHVAPLFNEKYPRSAQLRPAARVRSFLSRWSEFRATPFGFVPMAALKAGDFAAFCLGIMFSPKRVRRAVADYRNRTTFIAESDTYEHTFYRNTKGARYVNEAERRIVQGLLHDLGGRVVRTALDLGCGGGRWSELLLDTFSDARVIAVDRARTMVGAVQRRFKENPRFSALEGEFNALPLPDRSADVIVCIRAVKYAPDLLGALREFHRVLDEDGALIVEYPYPNIVSRLLRLIPFGGVSAYLRRIEVVPVGRLRTAFVEAGFAVEQWDTAFRIPASIYSSRLADIPVVFATLKLLDAALPKMFSRSIFIKARVQRQK